MAELVNVDPANIDICTIKYLKLGRNLSDLEIMIINITESILPARVSEQHFSGILNFSQAMNFNSTDKAIKDALVC